MDVRAKQRLSYRVVWFPLRCAVAVSLTSSQSLVGRKTSLLGVGMLKCARCGYSVIPREKVVTSCTQCGGGHLDLAVRENWLSLDELALTATNAQGEFVHERIQKTDLNTSANLAADLGKPSKISVERKNRITGFEEEGAAAEALVNSFNKLRRTSYYVQEKPEEDSDYADRVFTSKDDATGRINIQIRHLDSEIIAGIGPPGRVEVDRTVLDVITSISGAICHKANIDPKLKADTILLLMLLAPLGEAIRQAICENVFDCKGFKEIWILPFHEEAFPLNANVNRHGSPLTSQ